MRKKYLSALLFGALVVAPTSTFVSCSEDYDDDITELRDKITTNATDISSLVDEKLRNSETEIAALKAQSEALATAYKDADKALEQAIKDATNDAQGYADIQAAEAQKAAIAAAQKLVDDAVASLQASVDAANATIEEQGKTIASLLEADKALQEGISAAQASADKAYELAEQASKDAAAASQEAQAAKAAAAEVAENLNGVKDDLAKQTSALGERIDAVLAQANANKAAIEAQATSIEELKAANEQALAALSEKDDELKALIEKNQADIAALETLITETAQAAADNALAAAKVYVDEAVNAVKAELAQTKTLAESAQAAADEAKTAASDAQAKANDAQTKADDAIAKAIAAQGDATTAVADAQAAQAAANAAQTAATNAQTVANKAQDDAAQAASDASDAKTLADQNKTAIDDLKSAYEDKVAEIEDEVEFISGELGRFDGLITNLQNAVGKINSYMESLSSNVNNLITGIIVQRYEDEGTSNICDYNVYAQVSNSGAANIITGSDGITKYAVFPYPTASVKETLKVGTYNVQEYAGYIYATINPTNIDATHIKDLRLEDSKGAKSTRYTVDMTKAERANVQLTRSGASMWKIPVNSLITNAPSSWNPTDNVLYALSVPYKQDTLNAETKEMETIEKTVVSKYEIQKNPKLADVVRTTELTLNGIVNNPTNGVAVQFGKLEGTLDLGTGNKRVYKQYVECVGVLSSSDNTTPVTDGNKTFNDYNKDYLVNVLAGTIDGKANTIKLNCPPEFKNCKILLDYYAWNYDGTVVSKSYTIVFTEPLWSESTANVKANAPVSSTAAPVWSSDFNSLAFLTQVAENSDNVYWKDVAKTVTVRTTDADWAASNAHIYLYNEAKTASVWDMVVTNGNTLTLPAATTLGNTKQLRLNIGYLGGMTVGDHQFYLDFKDVNGYLVNTVLVKYNLPAPKVTWTEDYITNTWRVPATFDGNLIRAWASYNGTDATYKLTGSFNNLAAGYNDDNNYSEVSPFIFHDLTTYSAANGNTQYRPTVNPVTVSNGFTMQVPVDAVQDEHVYDLTAAVEFFGLSNLETVETGVWNHKFQVQVLSPIKYAIEGTEKFGGNNPGVRVAPISVKYGEATSITAAKLTVTDPATGSGFSLFGNSRDSRIANTTLKFKNAGGNNGLFQNDVNGEFVLGGNGAYQLQTIPATVEDRPILTAPVTVVFTLTVEDVWGVRTNIDVPVEVTPNN